MAAWDFVTTDTTTEVEDVDVVEGEVAEVVDGDEILPGTTGLVGSDVVVVGAVVVERTVNWVLLVTVD